MLTSRPPRTNDRFVPAIERLGGSRSGVDPNDPFVCWFTQGAYVYYDHKFDIVAINAVVWNENEHATSAINLGEASP